MATYIVSYDLIKTKDYAKLQTLIMSYTGYAKIQASLWAITSNLSATAVFDHLSTAIDDDDKLVVLKAGREAKWCGITDEVSTWIKDNF